MSAATFGEVYAALVRAMGTPDEVAPGCVAWLAPDRAGAGLTLQLIGPALVLSVIEPSTPRAHAHWTLAGDPTPSAPARTPDEAIPAALRWLAERGVVMRPAAGHAAWLEASTCPDCGDDMASGYPDPSVLCPKHRPAPEVPRCGGKQGFSRCAYAKGHPGPCSFQHAGYFGGYDP